MHSEQQTTSKNDFLMLANAAISKASETSKDEITNPILDFINSVFKPSEVPQLLLQNKLMRLKQILKDAGVNGADHQYITDAYQTGKMIRKDPTYTEQVHKEVVGYDQIDLQNKNRQLTISEDKEDDAVDESKWDDRLENLEDDPSPIIDAIDSDITDLEDIEHLYDLDELELADDILKEETLEEHISREERIRRKIRLMKSETKRERTRKMSLKRLSTLPKLTRKARKLAIELIKKKIAKRNLDTLSIQEKERLEDLVLRRKDLINRLTRKLVAKVKQIESKRVMGSTSKQISEDTELMEVELAHDIPAGWNMGLSHIFNRGPNGVSTGGFDDDLVKPKSEFNLPDLNGLTVTAFVHPTDVNRVDVITHDGNNIHHYVRLMTDPENHPGAIITKTVAKNQNVESPIQMHHVYDHLLSNGMNLMSDKTQSIGGLNIWKSLSKIPGVAVVGYDTKYHFPINTGKYLEDTTNTHKTIDQTHGENGDAAKHTMDHVRLIATKKRPEQLTEAGLFDTSRFDTFGRKAYLSDRHRIHDDFGGHVEPYGHIIGKTGSLMLKRVTEKGDDSLGAFYTHDEHGNVHHVVEFSRPPGYDKNTIVEGTLVGTNRHGKRASMDDVYAHLIKKHGFNIQSDTSHSQHGLNVWKRLSDVPGVSVHGWDLVKDIPINTGKIFDDVSADDTHVHEDDELPIRGETVKEYNDRSDKLHNVVLVAHKTIPMKRKAE